MLAEIANFAGVEVDIARGHGLARTLTAEMCDLGMRNVDYFPARVLGAAAKVDLFAEHEVAGVEEADLAQSLATAEEGRAAEPTHALGFVVRLVEHVEAAKDGQSCGKRVGEASI